MDSEWVEVADSISDMNQLLSWQKEKEYELGCKVQIINCCDGRIIYAYPKKTIYEF